MTQVTLVSLYGEKKREFSAFVQQCQNTVAAVVPGFQRYDPDQVHATIVGLERVGSELDNANFESHRKRKVEMDFDGFIGYLRGCGLFPIQVQLGGFGNREYPFRSRNSLPYERSFSIQGDKVVVMGWPIRGAPFSVPPNSPEAEVQESRLYPRTLDTLRQESQRFGILHAYHRTPDDVDNDLFFRIGVIDKDQKLSARAAGALENQIRRLLSESQPLVIELTLEGLFVVPYRDDTLPTRPTPAPYWPVTDPAVSGSFVQGLFD